MSYGERLANYEREKMSIPKTSSSAVYEDAIRQLAQKWKI